MCVMILLAPDRETVRDFVMRRGRMLTELRMCMPMCKRKRGRRRGRHEGDHAGQTSAEKTSGHSYI